MNFSLAFLSLSSSFSSGPLFSQKMSINIGKSQFSHCIHPIISNNLFCIKSTSFSSMLNTVIYNSQWLIIRQRYDSPSSMIENCIFQKITGTLLGGAIFSNSSSSLNINKCYFVLVHTTNEAGVIYKESGLLVLGHCCFYLCHSSFPTNNYGGNLIFSYKAETRVSFSNAFQCWNSSENAAESNMRIYYELSTIVDYNTSFCFGSGFGGILGEFWYMPVGSTVKFSYVFKGNDTRCICNAVATNEFHVSYSNFIQNTVYNILDDSLMFASHCSFYGNTILFVLFRSTTLTNCIADFSTTGVVLSQISFQSQQFNPAIECIVLPTTKPRLHFTWPLYMIVFIL